MWLPKGVFHIPSVVGLMFGTMSLGYALAGYFLPFLMYIEFSQFYFCMIQFAQTSVIYHQS